MKIELTSRILTAELPVVVRFDEARADILTFEFHSRPRGADWAIGRDLLTDGLTKRTGTMDVFIWPSPATDEVAIELRPPSDVVIVRLPWHPIASFVRATYDRVPQGTEYDDLDWNQLLPAVGGAS